MTCAVCVSVSVGKGWSVGWMQGDVLVGDRGLGDLLGFLVNEYRVMSAMYRFSSMFVVQMRCLCPFLYVDCTERLLLGAVH